MSNHLTEEMKQLMGIKPREFGGLNAMFQPAQPIVEFSDNPTHVPDPAPPARTEPLEERRSLTMFKGVKEMKLALERAHKLMARVNATVQHDRERAGGMNEKSRADMYRLDQELANGMDSLRACKEALDDIEAARKAAAKEAKERRRMKR